MDKEIQLTFTAPGQERDQDSERSAVTGKARFPQCEQSRWVVQKIIRLIEERVPHAGAEEHTDDRIEHHAVEITLRQTLPAVYSP